MISKKMVESLNGQVNAEMYSAYLYLSMSAWAESKDLAGIAHWLSVQAQEEMIHAMKLYRYVNDVGERVVLKAIAKPPAEWKSVTDVFKEVLAHEKKVTGLINALVNQAKKEKDNASEIFLQWFVTEQIEEEQSANEILARLKMVGEKGQALFMMDSQLGARVAPVSAPAADGE